MQNKTNTLSLSSGIPYGKIVSLLTFLSLFTILPSLLKLIWPTILQYLSGPQIYLFSALFVSIVYMGSYNLIMVFIYKIKHPFFEQYRSNNKPWPWEVDDSAWKKQLKKTFKAIGLNLLVINPLIIKFQLVTSGFLYSVSMEDWPSPTEFFIQFVFFILVMDVMFYISHSQLHRPQFYWIHKQHHEYSTTVMLATSYAHPIQYIVGNAVPVGLGHMILARLTKVHMVSMIVWYLFMTTETNQGHSGYNWSWSQLSFWPWKNHPQYHDFHHTHNSGNYGSMFTWLDSFFNTNKEYYKYKNKLKND